MTDAAPKERLLAERRGRIVAAARRLAEDEGWEAVTTRRLADAIEYSQPVLYGHFPQGKSEIVTAVALAGFAEMEAALTDSGSVADASHDARVRALVTTYLDFADRHRATYEAMFLLPVTVPFASADTPAVLRATFEVIAETLRALPAEAPPSSDPETTAEVLWAAVHGLVALQHAGRMPPERRAQRVDELVRLFTA
ncbi:TetR/AcrR family transcriptional regulator [Isoptericola croceus]|uniref:TetR/AcrR family transcriptional regulator n=1 Tax=Isoptericola croceus TaxID=3031406 RepID=UPI0023F9DF3C|nr:TetR/AcrR family transcriptional regulator [Isoptericola croceus]